MRLPIRAALLVAVLALPTVPNAWAASTSRCAAGKTLARTDSVRVFKQNDQVFSCWRKDRRRTVIRELYDDSYSVPAVAGRWLAYGAEHSDQQDYSTQVSRFDLRTGRKNAIASRGRVIDLVVKDNGSLAFVSSIGRDQDEVVIVDEGGRTVAFTGGPVARGSLRRDGGGGVSWVAGGERAEARLR